MKYNAATYVGIKIGLKKYLMQWKSRPNMFLKSRGDYFEGVWSTIVLSLLL